LEVKTNFKAVEQAIDPETNRKLLPYKAYLALTPEERAQRVKDAKPDT
jgi:hypothetical protein